jgi:hypothetical protein
MAKADLARTGSTIRCAIYTRKSSDEGLEQEFNSLDAQREACEAYIVSQRHAGWIALGDMYDDALAFSWRLRRRWRTQRWGRGPGLEVMSEIKLRHRLAVASVRPKRLVRI